MKPIVIIGAGAAGIAVARRLQELERPYILVEAKAFTGGRCVTDQATFGSPVDLGAHWFHSPAFNPLVPLADRLGVRYAAEALRGRYHRDGSWLTDADQAACENYLEAAFDRIAAFAGDIAIKDLFPDPTSPWHDAFLAELRAKQGVTVEESSSRDFARYVWEGDDLPVTGGFGTLLDKLTDGLNIRTATPVSRIDWSGRNIRVTTPVGGD